MAKTAKLKKSTKSPSTHSRLARRASSPSLNLNLDKSLPTLKTPHPTKSNILLAPHPSNGIHKSLPPSKKKGGKVLKRKQRARLEQGRERAEAVSGKMERKVERAGEKGVGRRGRNADWDELNERIGGKRKLKGVKGGKEEAEVEAEDGWEEVDMEVDGDGEGDVEGEGEVVGENGLQAEDYTRMEGEGGGGDTGGGGVEDDEIL